MNERIKELERRCWDNQTNHVNAEKLAELILRDINKIIDDLYNAMPLEQAAVLLTLDENIKQHFYGVES